MRIVQLIDDFGGHNYPDFLRCLVADGHEVQLGVLAGIEPAVAAALDQDGISVFGQVGTGRRRYGELVLRMIAMLGHRRVDVVHAHLFDAAAVGMAAGWGAGTPARVITRHYGELHHSLGKPWHTRVDRLAGRLAHRVVAVSGATRDAVVSLDHIPADKVEVIHNGIRLERFVSARSEQGCGLRRELGITNHFVLGVPARLHEHKGQRYLLDALPAIQNAAEAPLAVLLAGKGPDRADLTSEAARLGVLDMLHFLGWRDDIPQVLAASDVVVLPSVMDHFPQVVIEAMAVERPLVASRVGGIPEVVEDGITGLLVPPRSPDALASAVTRLLNDRELGKSIVEAASRRVRELDMHTVSRRYQAVYADVAGSHARTTQ